MKFLGFFVIIYLSKVLIGFKFLVKYLFQFRLYAYTYPQTIEANSFALTLEKALNAATSASKNMHLVCRTTDEFYDNCTVMYPMVKLTQNDLIVLQTELMASSLDPESIDNLMNRAFIKMANFTMLDELYVASVCKYI